MPDSPSIRDIARMAGVSVATVSRVINQNGRFSPGTEARVRQAIVASGYIPDQAARGLRTNKTQSVGVVVPNILNPYFAGLVFDLQKALFDLNYTTVICNTNESIELEQAHVTALLAQHVSGIIFISGNPAPMAVNRLPVVFLDRRPAQNHAPDCFAIIESDNTDGGSLAAQSLLDCGCSQVAAVYARKTDINQMQRLEGFRNRLSANCSDSIIAADIILDEVTADSARGAIDAALSGTPDLDGLFCLTDMLAICTLSALQQRAVRVPDDMCVIGFDDSPIAGLCLPPLTTIRQNTMDMARLAAGKLLDMIAGKHPENLQDVVPVELVRRATTRGKEEGRQL